jgi:hypothetical protein
VLVVFNLLALGESALAIAVLFAVSALGGSMLVAALAGCGAAALVDAIVRWRAGRRLMDPRAGGMVVLLPVWIWALFGAMAAVLIATALPDDWDRRRGPPDAGIDAR